VLDNDPSALSETSEILSSAGWKVEPFIDPDTVLDYAAMHQPAAAIINFGGSCVHALDIAAHLRAISPSTSVIISLKVHRSKAHKVLIGTEMVNLIKQRCVEAPGTGTVVLAKAGFFT
jgi:DNA-binding response OmpR family regulator